MEYKIRKGDSLTKIANKFNLPVTSILAINSQITDPDHISVGQVIYIPNMQDVPPSPEFVVPTDPLLMVLKARSVVNCKVKYKLGSGGMHPDMDLPTKDNFCDCSGFVCWVLGLSRKTTIPFYKQFGGWIFTDSIVADLKNTTGIFERIYVPQPGCVIVYSAGKNIGHVGVVSEVSNGGMKKVIHCSSNNSKKYDAAIQETSPSVFNRADALWGRFIG